MALAHESLKHNDLASALQPQWQMLSFCGIATEIYQNANK